MEGSEAVVFIPLYKHGLFHILLTNCSKNGYRFKQGRGEISISKLDAMY